MYTHAMSRDRRHQMISQILASEGVHSQDHLRMLLAERGLETTQATLSRDLRELGVVKGPGGYSMADSWVSSSNNGTSDTGSENPVARALDRVLEASILSVVRAGHLVVLKTPPGHAQVVAVEFDRRPPEGVAGTVAGDDTIFVACATETSAEALAERVRDRAGLNPALSAVDERGAAR